MGTARRLARLAIRTDVGADADASVCVGADDGEALDAEKERSTAAVRVLSWRCREVLFELTSVR